MSILLSVIIPTYKRPQYLQRAIDSALLLAPDIDSDIEVIVIPNGPDISWKPVAELYKSNPRVIWSPIVKAHANAARNHGMGLAKGKYIRFLDDDDYFYPEYAREQLTELINSGADLSYSCLEHVSQDGELIKTTESEDKHDYISAVTGRGNPTATLILVFSKSLVCKLRWSEKVDKKQDVYWAYSICAQKEFKSIYFSKPAGAWVQHDGERVSKGHSHDKITKEEAEELLKLYRALAKQNRLTNQRAKAIAVALWQRLHDGLMYDIFFWYRISKKAEQIMPKQYPHSPMYQNRLVRLFNPFWMELLIVPFRWLRVAFGHEYPL